MICPINILHHILLAMRFVILSLFHYCIIVRNLIPFQNLGLQSKTEALFRKMIIDFFVAFYPYFTMVKFFRVRSPLRSPQDSHFQSDKSKKRKNPCKSQIYGLLSEIISIISFPVTDLKCVQLLGYLYGAPELQRTK